MDNAATEDHTLVDLGVLPRDSGNVEVSSRR